MTDSSKDEPFEEPHDAAGTPDEGGEGEGTAGDGRPGTPEGNAAADEALAEEGMIAPDGPDVETPLSAEDQAFLDAVSAGAEPAAVEVEDDTLLQLRRVNAEYANYRKRVERDREIERERAVGDAIRAILPVLDDLDRAEKHGDLAEGGPITAIAQKLRTQVGKLGVTPFGEAGEAFDPTRHEAIFQKPNPDVERETVFDVVERGYRVGDTILRAAKVVVDTPSGS